MGTNHDPTTISSSLTLRTMLLLNGEGILGSVGTNIEILAFGSLGGKNL
jgi:hypothetical protein